jgi:tRNA (guanine37-N1)-methyltransferase
MTPDSLRPQPLQIDILTIFPAFFDGFLHHGVVARAVARGLVHVGVHDLRNFTHDPHRTVDDRPFGGGEGMVLKPEPLAEALDALGVPPLAQRPSHSRESVILLAAQGRPFTQQMARELAAMDRVILLCGRYEGIDERIRQLYCDREISIGDYVLSGGELAASVVADATLRLVPGVLGNAASAAFESFGVSDANIPAEEDGVPRSQHGSGGLLDYPHFTRPAEFRGIRVPDALLGGDHQAVRRWRREQQLATTLRNRPDLLQTATLSPEDQQILATLRAAASRNH